VNAETCMLSVKLPCDACHFLIQLKLSTPQTYCQDLCYWGCVYIIIKLDKVAPRSIISVANLVQSCTKSVTLFMDWREYLFSLENTCLKKEMPYNFRN